MILTRREVLAGVAATATGLAKPSQPATPVNFEVPAHACDCHTHIFGDPDKFPFSPSRTYTPETALPGEMAALHRALHVERVVIVTPSVYGTDNSVTLYGIRARGASARGIAVIGEKTTESELDAMGQAGIRGIRLNLATAGQASPAEGRQRLQRAVERMRTRGWHIQIYTNLGVI
ncbi:MAG: hydrolase, partial [Acidobacteriales bacterium]